MGKRGPKGPNKGSFKPGHPAVNAGRKPLSPEIRDLNKINATELSRLIQHFFLMTMAELELICAERTLPAIQLYIATMITHAINSVNPGLAKELLDRMAGRPKEQVVVTDNRDQELSAALVGVPDKTIVDYLRDTARLAA